MESTAVSTNTAGPGAVFNPAEIPPCCLQKPQVLAAGFDALLLSFSPVELTFLKVLPHEDHREVHDCSEAFWKGQQLNLK